MVGLRNVTYRENDLMAYLRPKHPEAEARGMLEEEKVETGRDSRYGELQFSFIRRLAVCIFLRTATATGATSPELSHLHFSLYPKLIII